MYKPCQNLGISEILTGNFVPKKYFMFVTICEKVAFMPVEAFLQMFLHHREKYPMK